MDMVVLEHINIDWKCGSDPIYQLAFPTWWTRSSSSWLLQTWFKQWKNISGLKFGGQGLASSTIDQCNVTNSDIFSVPKSVPVGYSKYNGLHKSSNTRCQTLNHIAKKKYVQGFHIRLYILNMHFQEKSLLQYPGLNIFQAIAIPPNYPDPIT